MRSVILHLISAGTALVATASGSVIYNNLTPNNQIAVATRPDSPGGFEIEAADDFVLTGAGSSTSLHSWGCWYPDLRVARVHN